MHIFIAIVFMEYNVHWSFQISTIRKEATGLTDNVTTIITQVSVENCLLLQENDGNKWILLKLPFWFVRKLLRKFSMTKKGS